MHARQRLRRAIVRVEQSSAELLAFLDDDCIPPPEWLDTLASTIDKYGAAGTGGTYDEEDPFLRARRCRQNYPDAELVDHAGSVGAGGNVAYRRAVTEQMRACDGHYFNIPAFPISQDKELAWRVRIRGGPLVFVPVKVRHAKSCDGWPYIESSPVRARHWSCRSVLGGAPGPQFSSAGPRAALGAARATHDSRVAAYFRAEGARSLRSQKLSNYGSLPALLGRRGRVKAWAFLGDSRGGRLPGVGVSRDNQLLDRGGD